MLKRIKQQETGNVFRWFEDKNIIASLVKGYFFNELNLRISTNKECLPEIRGSKQIMLNKSDDFWIEKIKQSIKSYKLYKNE